MVDTNDVGLPLQAFTAVFQNCNPESSVKLACLSAIEEMLTLVRYLPVLLGSEVMARVYILKITRLHLNYGHILL